MNQDDHDLLTRIDTNLTNHMKMMCTHLEDDKREFNHIKRQIDWMQRGMYMGLGALVIVKILFKF